MEDAHAVFRNADLNSNGRLTFSEFENMMKSIYSSYTYDELLNVFQTIGKENALDFDYTENVHNLQYELPKYGNELPDKNIFLQILIDIFGDQEKELAKIKSYKDLSDKYQNKI